MTSLWTTLGTGARTNYPWRHGNDILDYVIVGSGDLNTDHTALSTAITATNAGARGATIWIEGEVRYRGDTVYGFRNGQSLRGRGTGATLRCDTQTSSLQFMWNDDWAAGEAYATATDVSTASEFADYISSPTYTPTKGDWFCIWSWDQILGVSPHYGVGFGQYPLELHQVAYWDNSAKRIYVPAFVRDRISIAGALQVIPAATMNKRVVVADLTFRSYAASQPDYSTVLKFEAIDGLTIENVSIHRNGPGAVWFGAVANARVWGLDIQGSVADENVYGIVVGACQGVDIANFHGANTRHIFTSTSQYYLSGTAVTGATITNGSATWNGTNSFRNGMAVRLTTPITNFATGTNYWVVNRASGTFGLAATAGGSAITAGDGGSSNVIWQNCRFGTPLQVAMHDSAIYVQTKIEDSNDTRAAIDAHPEGWGMRFSDIDVHMAQMNLSSNVGVQTRCRGNTYSRVRVFGGSSPYGYGFRTFANDTTFESCEAHNTYIGIEVTDLNGVAGATEVDRCEIRDCRFVGVTGAPIWLKSGNNHRVIDASFKNCSTLPSSNTPYGITKSHIQIEYGTGHEIYECRSKKGSNDISVNIGPLAPTDVTIEGNCFLGYSRRDDANVATCEISRMKRLLTADSGTSTITWTSHPLASGDYVQFFINSGGVLPTGLAAFTWYYVITPTADTFQVSTTKGGSPVTLSSNGSGNWGANAVQQTLNATYQPYNVTTGGWALAAVPPATVSTQFQVANGTTVTSYATFALAYAAMIDGDTLILPPIDIAVSATLTWARNGSMMVAPFGRTRFIRATSTTDITTLLNVTGTDNVFDGITFEGQASGTNTSEGRLVTISAARNTLVHCKFLNSYTTGTVSNNYAVFLNASYNTVESCYISNATYGGVRSTGAFNRISDCRTYDCQYPIIHVGSNDEFSISNCHVYASGANKGTVYISGSGINGLKTVNIDGLYIDIAGYDYSGTGGGLVCFYAQELNISDLVISHTQTGTVPAASMLVNGVTRIAIQNSKLSGQLYVSGLKIANFTAAVDDTITKVAHGLSNGMIVTLNTSGTLPAGLNKSTRYYVVNAATDTLKLSLTPGGTAVDITDTGSGTHDIYLEVEKLVCHDTEIGRDVNYAYPIRLDSSPLTMELERCKIARATSRFILHPDLVSGHSWSFVNDFWNNNQAGTIPVFGDNLYRTGSLFFCACSNTYYNSAGGTIVSASAADAKIVCQSLDASRRVYGGTGTPPATTTVSWNVGDEWVRTDAPASNIARWQNVTAGTSPSFKALATLGA